MHIEVTLNQAALQVLPSMAQALMRRTTLFAAQGAARDLQQRSDTPKWRGTVATHTIATQTTDGASTRVDTPYAYPLHQGRKPGTYPNISKLAVWAADKGMAGAEWAIANKIKAFGTKPQPWVRNYATSMALTAMLQREVRRAMV